MWATQASARAWVTSSRGVNAVRATGPGIGPPWVCRVAHSDRGWVSWCQKQLGATWVPWGEIPKTANNKNYLCFLSWLCRFVRQLTESISQVNTDAIFKRFEPTAASVLDAVLHPPPHPEFQSWFLCCAFAKYFPLLATSFVRPRTASQRWNWGCGGRYNLISWCKPGPQNQN